MKAFSAIFGRELRAFFYSPMAYVVLFFFLVVNGFIFANLIAYLSDPRSQGGPPMGYFFTSSGILLMILGVILTMRLVSEELRSGSIEVLMTAPVTEGQVIAGKFLGALAFFAFLWLPTLAYAGVVAYFESVDWGPIASGYLGLLLVGSLFLSVGVFASSTTRSQLGAAMMSVALILLLILIGWLQGLVNSDTAKEVLSYVDVGTHLDEFSRGIVDTRRLVYYLSATFLFLFLAARSLEDRKWR